MESSTILFPRDPVSSLTHLVTSVFAVFTALILWRLARGDRTKQLSLAVFAVSAVVLYAMSGVYHAIPLPKSSLTVTTFRRLDHSAIYLLIAGTYTPVFAVLLHGRRRVFFLTLVWSLALIGVGGKWVAPIGNEGWTVGLYLAMGWLILLAGRGVWQAVGWSGVGWGVAGGVCYTTAAICELVKWPVIVPDMIGWHEVCHVLDMFGTAFHLVFMMRCVLPYQSPAVQRQTDRQNSFIRMSA